MRDQPSSTASQTSPHTGVDTGPQSGPGGAGGEPTPQQRDTPAPDRHGRRADDHAEPVDPTDRRGDYTARPAGSTGVEAQGDRASTLRQPQGDGNYVATDQGQQPLRDD